MIINVLKIERIRFANALAGVDVTVAEADDQGFGLTVMVAADGRSYEVSDRDGRVVREGLTEIRHSKRHGLLAFCLTDEASGLLGLPSVTVFEVGSGAAGVYDDFVRIAGTLLAPASIRVVEDDSLHAPTGTTARPSGPNAAATGARAIRVEFGFVESTAAVRSAAALADALARDGFSIHRKSSSVFQVVLCHSGESVRLTERVIAWLLANPTDGGLTVCGSESGPVGLAEIFQLHTPFAHSLIEINIERAAGFDPGIEPASAVVERIV